MKKSDKLSKKQVITSISNNQKNLIQFYNKNKKLIKDTLKIKDSYKLSDEDLIKFIKENTPIPISIFKNSSPLESLVKYLKDNLSLSLRDIASLLNRDQRTIWITYNNVNKKKLTLDISSDIKLQLHIFSDRRLSILENLTSYLIDELGYSISEISTLLNRDYKTIWTCYKRAKDKNAS